MPDFEHVYQILLMDGWHRVMDFDVQMYEVIEYDSDGQHSWTDHRFSAIENVEIEEGNWHKAKLSGPYSSVLAWREPRDTRS